MELKLHEAIEIILKEYDRPMTSREIADEVNKRGLYHRKVDSDPVPVSQTRARIANYPLLFEKEGSLIKLVRH